MERLLTLARHLETLDARLSSWDGDLKLLKEILLVRKDLHREAKNLKGKGDIPAERVESVLTECGANIGRINREYSRTVVCSRCAAADVAVVRKPPVDGGCCDFELRHNPRIRIHQGAGHSPGTFFCNSCLSTFTPPLPGDVLKVCDLLFNHYV